MLTIVLSSLLMQKIKIASQSMLFYNQLHKALKYQIIYQMRIIYRALEVQPCIFLALTFLRLCVLYCAIIAHYVFNIQHQTKPPFWSSLYHSWSLKLNMPKLLRLHCEPTVSTYSTPIDSDLHCQSLGISIPIKNFPRSPSLWYTCRKILLFQFLI